MSRCLFEGCPVDLSRIDGDCADYCKAVIEEGSRLRDIQFNALKHRYLGLAIFVGESKVAEGLFGDVLREVVHLADSKVKSCNGFFNEFVIRLEDDNSKDKNCEKTKIAIVVEGGMVKDIYSTDNTVEVMVLDMDGRDNGEDGCREYEENRKTLDEILNSGDFLHIW